MNEVFLLQHSYEYEFEGIIVDETKIIGIYSSQEKAEQAIEEYKRIQGFKDHPADFTIDKYPLDKGHWLEGFISVEEAMEIPTAK